MNKIVENRVINLIAKTQKISIDDIKLDQLIEDICEDSLDVVNLLFELEDEFDLSIPDEAKESKTIRDIVIGIEKLMNAKQDHEVGVI
jgi:acyl carrier protein